MLPCRCKQSRLFLSPLSLALLAGLMPWSWRRRLRLAEKLVLKSRACRQGAGCVAVRRGAGRRGVRPLACRAAGEGEGVLRLPACRQSGGGQRLRRKDLPKGCRRAVRACGRGGGGWEGCLGTSSQARSRVVPAVRRARRRNGKGCSRLFDGRSAMHEIERKLS